jgi:putative spermidine/putrescine transport system substrate-binding protein/spermidine/putrescine transport system substrate-binding protein
MRLEPAEVMSKLRTGEISRRDVMKLFGAIGIAATGAKLLGPESASAATDMNMIVWEGYTDESFSQKFMDDNDVTINTTFMATSDDAFAQLQAGDGANFDLVTASNDLNQRLVDAGLVQEIDPTRLTNFPDLYEQFQRPEYITFDDKLYGANFAWGPTILAYDANEITTAPDSWNAMLDEQYSGKISAWNYPIQIAQYALLLDPKPEDPYTLDDEQLAQVKDMLVKQRPLVRKYWDFAAEVADLFVNGEIVIADPPPYGVLTAVEQGANVVQVIPKEGATGWSDSWMITKGAKNIDLCYAWMDFMIGPDGQMGVLTNNQYAITNKKVIEGLDADLRKALLMDDVAANYAKIYMWKNVPNLDKWTQIWQEATSS